MNPVRIPLDTARPIAAIKFVYVDGDGKTKPDPEHAHGGCVSVHSYHLVRAERDCAMILIGDLMVSPFRTFATFLWTMWFTAEGRASRRGIRAVRAEAARERALAEEVEASR